MRVELRGLPAAPGVARGVPWHYGQVVPEASRSSAAEPAPELLEAAIARAEAELLGMAGELRASSRRDHADVLEAQALIARDPELRAAASSRVASGMPLAEAIFEAGDELARSLAELDDEIASARAADIRDVAARIGRALTGASPEAPPAGQGPWVLVGEDLPPSAVLEVERDSIAAVALERGSPAAHLAILSRGLGIPVVVGVAGLLDAVRAGTALEVDGSVGRVVVEPDHEPDMRSTALERDWTVPGSGVVVMRDGVAVTLKANIDRPVDAELAIRAGAAGIGLFRTEHLATGGSVPSMDAQTAAYRRVLDAAPGRPVAFRLFDFGGDKPLGRDLAETQTALRPRGIRALLARRDMAVDQIRAILAASSGRQASVEILVPMVADLTDVEATRALIAEAAAGLDERGVERADRVDLGVMVEVPSAVLLAGRLAEATDFISIGTNDLAQYLLAADRSRPELAPYHDPLHPAVLAAVRLVVEAASARSVPVSVCGEMAADPAAALVLAGLGIRELSMYPAAFAGVAATLERFTSAEAHELAARCLGLSSVAQVRAATEEFLADR